MHYELQSIAGDTSLHAYTVFIPPGAAGLVSESPGVACGTVACRCDPEKGLVSMHLHRGFLSGSSISGLPH